MTVSNSLFDMKLSGCLAVFCTPQCVAMRNYLMAAMASELQILQNSENQLLKYWLSLVANDMFKWTEADVLQSPRIRNQALFIAKEQIVQTAFALHCTIRNLNKSSFWARALRDVLGEKHITQEEAMKSNAKAYEEIVGNLTAKVKDIKLQITAAGKLTSQPSTQDVARIAALKSSLEEAVKGASSCTVRPFILWLYLHGLQFEIEMYY